MLISTRLLLLAPALTLLAACSSHETKSETPAPAPTAPAAKVLTLPESINDAVASDYRTPENKKRDQYRHPAETLMFFDLQAGQTVVEIWPSGGWYTEILAPFLAQKGHYIAAVSGTPSSEHDAQNKTLNAWMEAHPEVGAKIKTVAFDPPKNVALAPDGTVDRVLTFRNVHNWMGHHHEQAAFKAFFKALKHGGILGIEEHRAAAKGSDRSGKSGYVREADVIAMATSAGFKLAEKSEINANPKDTKDYPSGVWTLPPTLRLGDKDEAKYMAIGESDRMTLKFVKP